MYRFRGLLLGFKLFSVTEGSVQWEFKRLIPRYIGDSGHTAQFLYEPFDLCKGY